MDHGTYDGVDYGTVDYKNKTLKIMQLPYADSIGHSCDREVYRAIAEDEQGEEFEIIWDVINPEREDQSECCDWSEFSVRKI